MSLSIQKMVSDGTLSTIVLGVQYLQRNDMYMRIAGVETPQSGAPSGYTWSFLDNNTIRVLPVVPAGVEVVVYRRTDLDGMYNVYSQNAQFDESTIDENNQQLLYIAQEYFEQGVPAQLIDSVEYVREDTVNMYYRLKLSDGSYTTEFPIPKGGAAGLEALRRTYAEAGYNLVNGSFETGGTLNAVTDVLLQGSTGHVYAWTGVLPKTVVAGFDPVGVVGFELRTDVAIRDELQQHDGYKLLGEATSFAELRNIEPASDGQVIKLAKHTSHGLGGGEFYYDAADTATADDNGYIAVTAGGKRWKRRTNGGPIYATDFGAAAGSSLDAVITNCMAAAARLGVTKIFLPYAPIANPCTLTGGLSFETPAGGIEIAGLGDWISCAISHTGNNAGITFTKGASTNLFSQAKLTGIRAIGNAGASACLAEFQDSWGCGLKDVYGSGYSTYALITLHNRTGWTEGFHLNNVMSRGNKSMLKFKRTAASGGTDSFFGLYARDVWHQFGVGNSLAFDLTDAAAPLLLYGADIEIGGWFESGGGHRYFAVGTNNSFVDSVVTLRADGFGGITDGSDLYLFRTSASTSRIDVEVRTLCQQGNSINVSALASGSVVGSVRHIVSQNNKFDHVNSRPCCRVKGAKIRFIQTGITTDKTLVIDNLPSYSTWKATLTANGSNVEFVEEYRIEVGEQNWLARVISLGVPATATGDTINSNIKLQAVGGSTGGGFSSSGGGKIEWKLFAATLASTYESTLELEML